MAILQVNRPAAVAKPTQQKQDDDPLAKIAAALGVATSVLGIAGGIKGIKTQGQQQELNQQKLAAGEEEARITEGIKAGNLADPAVRRRLESQGDVITKDAIDPNLSQASTSFQVPAGQQGPEGPTLFRTPKAALAHKESKEKIAATSALASATAARSAEKANRLAEKRAQSQTNFENKRFSSFADKVNNSSQRRRLGRTSGVIDSTENALVLADMFGGGPQPGETREQRIARFDQADSRQISELVKSLDRVLSTGVPTESGFAHLNPVTFEGLANKYGEKIIGSPRGAQQGEFVERMLHTIERERDNSIRRKKIIIEGMSAGFNDLKEVDPERFAQIIEKASQVRQFGDEAEQEEPGLQLADQQPEHMKTVQGGPQQGPGLAALDDNARAAAAQKMLRIRAAQKNQPGAEGLAVQPFNPRGRGGI